MTGDLIASGSDYVGIVARALGGLRARDGVFAAMGNHDYFGDGEAMVSALEGAGLTVLRNRGVELRRDSAAIWLAGVDDTWTRRHDLGRALAGAAARECPRCCWRTIRCCFPRPPNAAWIWCCRATPTAVRWPCRCSRAS